MITQRRFLQTPAAIHPYSTREKGRRTGSAMARYLASLLFAVTVLTGGAVLAQGADVALVNLLSGEVSYMPRSGTPGRVRPFMKVQDGDRIDVAAGSQIDRKSVV